MTTTAVAPAAPLSIAVIGVGKIGGTFSYQFVKAGHAVTVVARPGSVRLQQLQQAKGILLDTGERAEVRIADRLDEQTPYDLVVVAAQRRGRGASWAEGMGIAHGLRSGFAIITGLGYPLYPRSKVVMNALPTPIIAFMLWAVSRVTSFREVLAQGTDEARALTDSMVKAAGVKPALSAAVKAVLTLKPTELTR